jgi:hypothetical protein
MKTPKPNTRLKRSRPKKARKHLPALSQLTRDMLALQMQADSRIPANVSAAIMASMNAAANKDAETPAVVIASLEREEQAIVRESMPAYQQILSNVGARGSSRMLLDFELDSLIEQEANDD